MTTVKTANLFVVFAAALALTGTAASAQTESKPGPAVAVSGGLASGQSTTGAALGGSLFFNLTDRTALEVGGGYFDLGAGADALSASASLLIDLVSPGERVVPYAAIGGGVYRASFDLASRQYLGAVGSQFQAGDTVCAAPGSGTGLGPGPGFGAGTGTCAASATGYWGVGNMPDFYGRRMGPLVVPVGGAWETRSFTDPAMSLGGGLRFDVNEHLMLRPDARALVVFGDGNTHTVGVFQFNVGYRF